MGYTLTRNYDGYGSGLLSPDNHYFYINISKNASSYMVDVLSRQGWTVARHGHDTCNWDQVACALVVLRDPVDRWISGVAQYLVTKILNPVGTNTYHDDSDDTEPDTENHAIPATAFVVAYSALIERFVFDNLDLLDDHVWPQHEFFESILPDVPRHYIMLDHSFEQQLERVGVKSFVDGDRNASDQHIDHVVLKKFFQDRLHQKPALIKRVQRTYARDYELIRNAFPKH